MYTGCHQNRCPDLDSCLITQSSKLKDINHVYYRIWKKENLKYAHLSSQEINWVVTFSPAQNSKTQCVCKLPWLARLQEASKYDNSKLRGPHSYLVQKGDNADIGTSCYIKARSSNTWLHGQFCQCVKHKTISNAVWWDLSLAPQKKADTGWLLSTIPVCSKLLSTDWFPVFPVHQNIGGQILKEVASATRAKEARFLVWFVSYSLFDHKLWSAVTFREKGYSPALHSVISQVKYHWESEPKNNQPGI